MIEVYYESAYDTLLIEFQGEIDVAQVECLFLDIQKISPRLKKKFKLLTDLSGVTAIDVRTQPSFVRIMDFLNTSGVAAIVRVVSKPAQDIGLNILSVFHYSKEVSIRTVSSRPEAVEYLKKMSFA